MKNKKLFQIRKAAKPLHWKVLVVLVDVLLDSVVIVRDGYSLLYDEYVDIFKMVTVFATKAFDIDPAIPLLLLLRKLQRALAVTSSNND